MFTDFTTSSKWIGTLGAIAILAVSLASGVTYLSALTLLGGLLGFLSVIQIVNRNWWAGITGTLSAFIYIAIAIIAKNPSDAILNVVFLVALDIPIILNREWQHDAEPHSITGKQGLVLFSIFVVAFLGLHFMEVYLTHTPRAIWSPLAATLGIVAAVSTGYMRVKQGFFIWSAQNVLQVVLWSITASMGDATWVMAVTYLFYTLNAGSSFFNGKWFAKKKVA